jgi:hypothetical protein
MRNEYDLNSAITFLLVGLGIESLLAIVLNPKGRLRLERSGEARSWRSGGWKGHERLSSA